MIIWGGILVLSCGGVYLYAKIVPALNQAADQMAKDAKQRQQYREGFVKSARESCLRREAASSPERTAALCERGAQRTADVLVPADLVAPLKGSSTAPQAGQEIRDAVEQCRCFTQ